VGNGEKVKIWKNHWLPSSPFHSVFSEESGLSKEALVQSLINRNIRWWDTNMIHSLFTKAVAAQIYGIPLSSLSQPDKILWKGTTHGCFSVRSAYYIEMAMREQGGGECSWAGEQQGVWKLIWNLKVPGTLKNFAWKVGANLLPTKANLVSRRIGDEPFCPIRKSAFETISHIVWECPSSVAIWQECS
jgi:hypothetical protein